MVVDRVGCIGFGSSETTTARGKLSSRKLERSKWGKRSYPAPAYVVDMMVVALLP
jgi:hypothetical protein